MAYSAFVPVPETAVNKHGKPESRKDEIWRARKALLVKSVSESSSIHGPPDARLGSRVDASYGRHVSTPRKGRLGECGKGGRRGVHVDSVYGAQHH